MRWKNSEEVQAERSLTWSQGRSAAAWNAPMLRSGRRQDRRPSMAKGEEVPARARDAVHFLWQRLRCCDKCPS